MSRQGRARRGLPGDVVSGAAAACSVLGARPAARAARGFGQGRGYSVPGAKGTHGDGHGPIVAPPPPKAELHRPLV